MAAFDKFLRALIEQATHEAGADGSATIEAQHLLLAMAAQPETELGRLLTSLGLDQRALRAALEQEFVHALSSAGVSVDAAALPREKSASHPAGQVGPSVQHALERGLESLRQAPRPEHLLLGVLQAEVGTVPRALALAGFDRAALIARVQQALAPE